LAAKQVRPPAWPVPRNEQDEHADMIRTSLRVLATLSLAVAVVMAVLDAARSIAADALALNSIGDFWLSLSPDSLEGLREGVVESLPGLAWDPVVTTLLSVPASAMFALLALLLYMAGRPARRRHDPFVLEG
jgi:hypothetical protein